MGSGREKAKKEKIETFCKARRYGLEPGNTSSFHRSRVFGIGPGFSDGLLYVRMYAAHHHPVSEDIADDLKIIRELAPKSLPNLRSEQLGSYSLSQEFISYMRKNVNPDFLSR
jgi:hypothetical protein